MNNTVLFAILAVSMVSAFSLAGESFAQTAPDSILKSAVTGGADNTSKTTVIVTFAAAVADNISDTADFTVNGAATTGVENATNNLSATLTIANADAFDASATPLVRLVGEINLADDATETYTNESVVATDGVKPSVVAAGTAVTGPNKVTVKYDERVVAKITDYTTLEINQGVEGATDLPRNIMKLSGSGTDTHTITFYGTPASTGASGTIAISGGVADLATNELAAVPEQDLIDAQAPYVVSATVTGTDKIQVKWSETLSDASDTAEDYTNIRIDGKIVTLANDGATHLNGTTTLTLATGTALKVSATGLLNVGVVSDDATSANDSAARLNVIVTDGQRPALADHPAEGAETDDKYMVVSGPNTITIKSQERVLAGAGTFGALVIDADGDTSTTADQDDRSITAVAGSGTDTLTLTFDGDGVGTGATATVTVKDSLTDVAGNVHALLAGDPVPAQVTDVAVYDGQAPTLVSAGITTANKVTVTFSEAMGGGTITATTGGVLTNITDFLVTGQRTASTLTSAAAHSSIPNAYDITFGSNDDVPPLASAPADSTGTISVGKGVLDSKGNPIVARSGVAVDASQRPAVKSIEITGPDQVTVVFTESVTAVQGDFNDLRIDGSATARTLSGISPGNGPSATYTLTFGGDKVGTGATATIDISKSVVDGATPPNAIGKVDIDNQPVSDGQRPEVELSITGPNQLTAEFTEPVIARMADFDGLTIGPTTGGEARKITGFAGSGSTYTMAFNGDPVADDATGYVDISGKVADRPAGNKFVVRDGDGAATEPVAGKYADVPVGDGQAPALESISITGPNQVTAKFSEAVKEPDGGDLKSAFVAFRLSDGNFRNINDVTSEPSASIKLTFGGTGVPTGTSGTVNVTGGIEDTSGNAFQVPSPPGYVNYAVKAGQIPTVLSAKVTGPNQLTVEFSESVSTFPGDYTDLRIDGSPTARAVTNVSTIAAAVELTFDGDPVGTDAVATVDIAGPIDNASPRNTLKPLQDKAVEDGQPPRVTVSITGPNQLTAEFTEPVATELADFDGLMIAAGTDSSNNVLYEDEARKITGFAGSGSTYTMAFDGDAVGTDATAKIDIMAGISDTSRGQNAFAGFSADGTKTPQTEGKFAGVPVSDGQAPLVLRGEFADANSIKIVYSEGVTANAVTSYPDLVFGANDNRDPAGGQFTTATHQLLFTGDDVDRSTTGVINNVTGVKDLADIALEAGSIKVEAMGDPTLLSARITGSDRVTVTFSEPVTASAADFTGLVVGDAVDPRNVTGAAGSGTDTITLTFDGPKAPVGTSGQMDVSDSIADLIGNALSPKTGYMVAAGQVPVLVSAAVTGPNQITVAFSEGVTAGASAFANLQLFPGGPRSVTAVSGSGTDTITLTFDGPAVSTAATALLDVTTGIVDNDGTAFVAVTGYRAEAGQPPALSSVTMSSDNQTNASQATVGDTVTLGFTASEAISLPAVTIDGNAADSVYNLTGNQWTASRVMQQGDTDGRLAFTIDYSDMDGNDGTRATATTDGSSVFYSNVGLSPLHVSSAVTGPNSVTVTFTEPVTASAADFANMTLIPGGVRNVTGAASAGSSVTVTFGGAAVPAYATASVTVGSGITDADGNMFAGPLNVAAADGQAPSLPFVGLASSNDDPGFATVGDTVTLSFTASEPISDPIVSMNGSTVQASNASGNQWTAARTFTDAASLGASITFSVDYADDSMNQGVRVVSTTDGSAVSTGQCPPGQEPHPYTSQCITPLAGNVKVGLLLSDAEGFKLAGEETILTSAKAVTDFNQWLADQGRDWTLVAPYTDTKFDSATTLAQVQALRDEGTDVVLGVPFSSSVGYVMDYVNTNGMVLVSCCSEAPSLAQPDNVFRMSPTSVSHAPILAQHIVDSGKNSLVIIYRDDTWGAGLLDAVTASYQARGGSVIAQVAYDPGTTDFAETAAEAETAAAGLDDTSGVGVLFIGVEKLVGLSAAASTTDTLPSLTWFDAGQNANNQNIVTDATALAFATSTGMTSIHFKEQRTDKTVEVMEHVRENLGRDPTTYAYSAYDAVWVAGMAIDRAQSATGTDVLPHVPAVAASRTSGAIGPNTLDANGDLALSNYNLWAVQGGAWKDLGTVSTPSVQGTVFSDADGNGAKGALEAGIEADVTLFNGSTSYTSRSNAGGYYSFSAVAGGDWTVQVAMPATHVPSVGQSFFETVTVAAGATQTVDFALEPLSASNYATVTGTVFVDADGDGTRGSGEAGMAGYTMYAIDALSGQSVTATTGPDGTYAFDSIAPAPRLTLVQTGYFPPGHTLSTDAFYSYVTPERRAVETFDVGFYPVPQSERVSLSVTAYMDANANGIRDAGEAAFPGAQVQIYSYTINTIDAITTGDDGVATKTDLLPANWQAQAYPPAGYVATAPADPVTGVAGAYTAVDPAPGSSVTMLIGLAASP